MRDNRPITGNEVPLPDGQFGALARGDVQQVIDTVPVHELRAITGFLRALRARPAYAEEVRAQRDADAATKRVSVIKEMADKVEAAANETAAKVGAAVGAMTSSATAMAGAAEAASQNADTASHATADALSSAQTVAASTEEMAASIREITNHISHAGNVAREAVEESDAAKRTIIQLNPEVDRIGHITSLIAEIASQTNLLALNATIEAARAGDGFAAVAAEVRKLAAQTAKATDDISGQIAQIQRATTDTVEAVTRIGGKVGEIDEVSAAIAAAMEQQSAATQEISRSVSSAAVAAQTVTESDGECRQPCVQDKRSVATVCLRALAAPPRAQTNRGAL